MRQVLPRILIISAASNTAVFFVIQFGASLWPQGLPAGSQHIFWLASGVNLACLLIFGLRYWPVILLDAIPAAFLAGQHWEGTIVGSLCNGLEALFAGWLILRLGAFDGTFERIRTVGALVLASVLAPLINTLIIPGYFCLRGLMPKEEYWRALANWNLANGAAMLLLAPLIILIHRGNWRVGGRRREAAAVGAIGAVLALAAFAAVFAGQGLNFAFLAFPLVIYVAVRFGAEETAVALGLTLIAIYANLVAFPHTLPPARLAEAMWFVQAFTWVLAATGLLLAALSTQRRSAELRMLEERGRSLEASLRAERARLDALRYQLNPHFLFNSLNSIRSTLPLTDSVPRAMITDLASYLRSTLDHEDTDRVPLEHEVRSAQDYLAIERRRFGERLRVKTDLDPGSGSQLVPVFLLQPLVENAIRHGLEKSKEPCEIEIRAHLDDSLLHVEVANSGAWKKPVSADGIGLANIRQRLELLYGGRATLHLDKSGDWVRVVIGLPR